MPWLQPSPSYAAISLVLPFLLPSYTFTDIGPTQIIQNNLIILKSADCNLNSICNLNSLLLCDLTYSQVPEIRTLTSSGWGNVILPARDRWLSASFSSAAHVFLSLYGEEK